MTDVIYFSPCDTQIPRIVAAKLKRQIKNKIGFNDCAGKPRISGDLRIVDRSFRHLRYAEVRDGCLILYRYVGNNKVWDFRIPLYNLNINLDSPKHYCQFSLSKSGEIAPIATFQVIKEQTYKKWLKCLAVEVIRQTPLNTLKFMDILFIDALLEKRQDKFKSRPKSQPRVPFLDTASPPPADRHFDGVNYSNGESDSLDDIRKPLTGGCRIRNFDDGESDPSNTSISPDHSGHDLDASRYSFRCCDACDTHNKSNFSVDSGYCSLQSGYGKCELSESETENNHVSKPFDELFEKFEHTSTKRGQKTKTFDCAETRLNFCDKFKKLDNTDDTSRLRVPESTTYNLPADGQSTLQNCIQIDESYDKENRRPNFQTANEENSPTIETAAKSTDSFSSTFHSKTEYYRNFKPQSIAEPYTVTDKFELKRKSLSQSNIPSPRVKTRHSSRLNAIPDVLKDLPDTFPRTKRKPSVSFHLPEEILQNENASVLVRLITKCQIDKEYVPVREKRILFESLSRFSFSVDNLKKRVKSETPAKETIFKYRSLSDLNKSHIPVSVMKTYFESFNEKEEK